MKIFTFILFFSIVTSANSFSLGEPVDTVDLDNPYLLVSGSNYTSRTKDSIHFQRFSDKILSMPKTESMLNAVKAHTTTGIVLSFRTASPTLRIQFTVMAGENRGHNYAVYQDSVYTDVFSFSKTDGPDLVMDIASKNTGSEVLYEISMPNWSITALSGLILEQGYDLSVTEKAEKPLYVAYGNSITHGTGQSGTHKTYPFLLSRDLDYELFSLAVGGAKTSVAVAEMLRDDFDHIDIMTMLIGYNDYNGEGIDTTEYRSRYMQFLRTFREVHDTTLIYCLSLTYTTNIVSAKSGIPADDFRAVVEHIVAELNAEGDENVFLIKGDSISSIVNLNGAVHFTEDGALLFSKDLGDAIKNLQEDTDLETAINYRISPDKNSVKLVPEVGFSSLFIDTESAIERISIFNIEGKLLLKEHCADHRIDISSISSGPYILELEFKNKALGKSALLFYKGNMY